MQKLTTRYLNSFKEFFRNLFRIPSSISDFWSIFKAQQPYVYVVIGSLFFVVGGYLEISQRQLISNSIPVAAKVVKIDKKRSKSNFVFRPVLEIEKSDGSKHQYKGNTWISPNPHTTGEIVNARYSQDDGRIVSIEFISRTFYAARMSIFIGGGAAFGGFMFLWWRRRKSLDVSR